MAEMMSLAGILPDAKEIADFGAHDVATGQKTVTDFHNINALQNVDPSNPDDMNRAAGALVGLGQTNMIDSLQNYALSGIKKSILSQAPLNYDSSGKRIGTPAPNAASQGALSQTQAPSAQGKPSDNSVSVKNLPDIPGSKTDSNDSGAPNSDSVSFHTQVVQAANSIKAAGPEGSPQRQQAYQAAVQHYQNMGVSDDVIKQELPDISDASLNGVIVSHVGHAVHAMNGTGPYAQGGQDQTVSVPQAPDTNTYDATKAIAQNPDAPPQAASAIPASTATATAEVPQDPDTVPSPVTGMSKAQARAYLSPEYKDYVAKMKLAGVDYSGNIDTAEKTMAPDQGAAETSAKQDAEKYLATAADGHKHQFESFAAFKKDQAEHPGYWNEPSPDVQAGRNTLATNLVNLDTSGTTDLSYADGSGVRTFASKADAIRAVEQNPGVYGDLGPHAKAIASSVTPFSVTSTAPDGSAQNEQVTAAEYERRKGQGENLQVTNYQEAIGSIIPGSRITSATRSEADNKRVGGVANSAHLEGRAVDIALPQGMSLAEGAAQIKSQFPEVTVIQTKAGTLNANGKPEGAHLHVQWPASSRSSGGQSGGGQSGFGVAPSQVQASSVQADNDQYNKVRAQVTDQSYRAQLATQTQNGLQIKGLAQQYAAGPTTANLNKLASFIAPFNPQAQKHASDVTLLNQDLANGTRQILSQGSGVRNEKEFEAASAGVSSLNDPKQSIVYNGAMYAASKQLEKAYSDAMAQYDADPKNQKKYSNFEQYWNSTAQGKLGVWGMPALQGVTISGAPLITHGKYNGKPVLVVGAGLGKNAQVIYK